MWRVTEVSNQFLHPAFTPTIDFLDKSLVSEIVYIQIVFIHWTDGAEDQNNDILSYNGTESSKFLCLTSPYKD